jgi:hypothetical protein
MTTLNRLNHAPSNLVGGVWAPLPAGGLESRNPAHPVQGGVGGFVPSVGRGRGGASGPRGPAGVVGLDAGSPRRRAASVRGDRQGSEGRAGGPDLRGDREGDVGVRRRGWIDRGQGGHHAGGGPEVGSPSGGGVRVLAGRGQDGAVPLPTARRHGGGGAVQLPRAPSQRPHCAGADDGKHGGVQAFGQGPSGGGRCSRRCSTRP